MTAVLNKEGLRLVIASLTGLGDTATRWKLSPQAFVSDTDRAAVILELFGLESLGVDEHRTSYGDPAYGPTAYVTTEIGNRTLTVTVRAEAYDAEVEAAEILDQIRTGIRADAVTAQLNALNLAFVQSEKSTPVPYEVDTRVVNCAIADFTFAGIAQLVSSVDNQAGYVSDVNGNNTVPGTLAP